jgi:uncharacterized protein
MDGLWSGADDLASCRLAQVEASAALARAARERRIAAGDLMRAKAALAGRWQEIDVVELEEKLAAAAGNAAESRELRAGDAIHLAAALRLADSTVVLATWDQRLRTAAAAAGLAIAPSRLTG